MVALIKDNKWIIILSSIAILAIIVFLGRFSIPLLGIILIVSGCILRKKGDQRLQIFGKISLFVGIILIIISAIVLSLVMPWSETVTNIIS